jgi:uncharacterized membrane protein
MALMLLVVRLLSGAGRGLWLLGAVALALPWVAAQGHAAWPDGLEWLNAQSTNWLGLISRKPITEDYAPLFPWLGAMCFGMAVGQWILQQHASALERVGQWLSKGVTGSPLRGLALLGRWSLSYYMLHQPLLIGALSLVSLVLKH